MIFRVSYQRLVPYHPTLRQLCYEDFYSLEEASWFMKNRNLLNQKLEIINHEIR